LNEVVKVEFPIDAAAADVLKDDAARERVGRLISRVALLYHGRDILAEVLTGTAQAAADAGLTDSEVDAELAAYNSEQRD
jgi:hypothetical protein